MTGLDPVATAFARERSHLPDGQFIEPALYWLERVHTGQVETALTPVVMGDAVVRLAMLPPVRPHTVARLAVVSTSPQPDGSYVGRAASHQLGNNIYSCFNTVCRSYNLFENPGFIEDPESHPQSDRHQAYMGLGSGGGLIVRTELSALLREVATSTEMQDAVSDPEAHARFLRTAAAGRHRLPEGLLGAAIAANERCNIREK